MEKYVHSMVNRLIQSGVIEESDRDIYETGVRQLYVLILDFFGILVIGVLFQSLLTALIISLLFMLLQRYAGSYHASTRIACYIESMIMIAGNVYIFQIIHLSWKGQLIFLFILLITIPCLAPVENRNRRLDKVEVRVYRARCGKTCMVYGLLWCLCTLLHVTECSQMIIFALIDVELLQLLGKLDLFLAEQI